MGSGFKTFTAGSVLTASDVQNYLQDQAVMVFGGTAARSSAIGTANFEEGMLTYLTDVDKLQVYTGSSFQDVYPPAATSQGMTLINTTSFSGVASQAINNVFTTTYDNYLIVIGELIGSTTATCQFKLRVGGVDNSTSYYWGLSMTNSLAAAVLSGGSNTDHFRIGNLVNAVRGFATFSVNAPFLTKETLFAGSLFNEFGGALAGGGSGGLHASATSFDGFNIIASTGTVTGKVSVYGYNK